MIVLQTRVLSRNIFFCVCGGGGKDGRGKYGLSMGLGQPPPGSVSVPVLKHIYLSMFTGRQDFAPCHYFVLQLGKIWGRSLSVWERSFPPTAPCPSRLNSENLLDVEAVVTLRVLQIKAFPIASDGFGKLVCCLQLNVHFCHPYILHRLMKALAKL